MSSQNIAPNAASHTTRTDPIAGACHTTPAISNAARSAMTDRVVIEGPNLAVTIEQEDQPYTPVTNGDTRSPSGWTLEEMIDMPNPFHPEPKLDAHYDESVKP